MNPLVQYCVVGVLFLISAAVMAISAFAGHTHSKLDVLVIIFSAISLVIACDQFRRAFTIWYGMRKKLAAVESSV